MSLGKQIKLQAKSIAKILLAEAKTIDSEMRNPVAILDAIIAERDQLWNEVNSLEVELMIMRGKKQ